MRQAPDCVARVRAGGRVAHQRVEIIWTLHPEWRDGCGGRLLGGELRGHRRGGERAEAAEGSACSSTAHKHFFPRLCECSCQEQLLARVPSGATPLDAVASI